MFVKIVPKTIANTEDGKQLIKSSGSVGANYSEANESFINHREIKINIRVTCAGIGILVIGICLLFGACFLLFDIC